MAVQGAARHEPEGLVGHLTSVVLCAAYIAISAALINFNKFMMHKDRFPYATALNTTHMLVSLVCGTTLLWVKPSLFPAWEMASQNKGWLAKRFAPLAILFAIGVVLSNQAYLYSSVSFLQFMKQGNIALIFVLSCVMGSQVCDRMKLFVVCLVVSGCCAAVTGEVHFVLLGFIVQGGSQLGECGKNILQEWMLTKSDVKLDPLTYNLLMAPTCLCVLAVMNAFTWNPEIPSRALHWLPYLIPNALCAFLLNLTISLVIKNTSAMGFILAGVVKDMVIVSASGYIFGDTLARQQLVGFFIATTGIFYWSFMKIRPDHSVVQRLANALGSTAYKKETPLDAEEAEPLMGKKV